MTIVGTVKDPNYNSTDEPCTVARLIAALTALGPERSDYPVVANIVRSDIACPIDGMAEVVAEDPNDTTGRYITLQLNLKDVFKL